MADRNHPVFALSDGFVDAYAAARPIEATYLGVAGHDHEWGDLGLRGVAALETTYLPDALDLDGIVALLKSDPAQAAQSQDKFRDSAESEMTRYLGWPAQAISYKLGERTILDLRDRVAERDGSGFDLKAFHAEVLGRGPVGLDHLCELVLADGP